MRAWGHLRCTKRVFYVKETAALRRVFKQAAAGNRTKHKHGSEARAVRIFYWVYWGSIKRGMGGGLVKVGIVFLALEFRFALVILILGSDNPSSTASGSPSPHGGRFPRQRFIDKPSGCAPLSFPRPALIGTNAGTTRGNMRAVGGSCQRGTS